MIWPFDRSFVRKGRGFVPLLLASGALAAACAARSSSPEPEPVGSTEAPIEGGRVINDPQNPVSSLFPLSTVNILINTMVGGDVVTNRCTGVILSSTKILTAAHCLSAGGTPGVYFYPTTAGASTPTGNMIGASSTVPIAKPPGVVCPPSEKVDPTCSSGTHYADLGVLTLYSPIPAPYKPVVLAPKGSFYKSYLANTPPTAWTVGTGTMNWVRDWCKIPAGGDVPPSLVNPNRSMQWVPTFKLGSGGSGIVYSSAALGDPGDSGGPIYQYAGDGKTLALIGILSRLDGSCEAGAYNYNTYTDVTQSDNYDWLVAQGATKAPTTASFGAAL